MRQIIPGYLSSQKHNHHIEGTVVTVELSCRLDQRLPVLRVFVYIVFAQLLADFLQLRVEAHHQLLEFWQISHLVADGY